MAVSYSTVLVLSDPPILLRAEASSTLIKAFLRPADQRVVRVTPSATQRRGASGAATATGRVGAHHHSHPRTHVVAPTDPVLLCW
jgi:hypothetical protein